jgi:hypothetical protein
VFNKQENNVTEALAVVGFSLGIVSFEFWENDWDCFQRYDFILCMQTATSRLVWDDILILRHILLRNLVCNIYNAIFSKV